MEFDLAGLHFCELIGAKIVKDHRQAKASNIICFSTFAVKNNYDNGIFVMNCMQLELKLVLREFLKFEIDHNNNEHVK